MRRIAFTSLFASMVASGLGGHVVAHAEAKPAVKAASEPAKAGKKLPPRKPMAISAEHKKALAELYGGFKLGMTKDEVIAVFSKQLDERYEEKIKATTDITAQDRLRQDKKAEVTRLQASYTSFDAGKPSPWDVSIVEDEFAHDTGEAMLERWENQGGKNQRRFFFFFDGKLWKMLLSLDVSILPEDKKTFATFRQVMEGKYGAGEVDDGKLTWRTPEFEVRALDKLKTYDALALVIEDPRTRKQVDAMRETKATPRSTGSAVIKAVVDPNHTDHPDVNSNSDAIDTVIRAQGGEPPKSKSPPKSTKP
jgi:hypothetical protein